MFLLENGTVVYSASDLTAASNCEWATMRKLDARLGRVPRPPETTDDMLERTARLGDIHEERFLHTLRDRGPVVEIERPHHSADPSVEVAATASAFAAGAPVVYQAAFFDGRFLGFADFIIRTVDGTYEVYDTKLARHAKVTALLQLAAYSEQLQRLDIPTGEFVYLVLGDNSTSVHRLSDIAPVYRKRRARLEQIIDERVSDAAATEWGDPRYTACGRCAACEEQVQSHRDVLLVAGMRVTQRARLIEAGVRTIDQLARRDSPVSGLADATLRTLREQAAVQIESDQIDPVQIESGQRKPGLAWRVMNPHALAALPAPDAGDIFFDFEGDPLHQEGNAWGLDYLFGLVEPDETFRSFWAHDLAGEKRALMDFLDYVAARRESHPGMHIYHYASYERSHLLSIAARHGACEAAVDDLLRNAVLVDLYPIVKQSLRIGSRSYSLKKLEPLYMGERAREGVSTAADSITEYVRSRDLARSGQTDAAAVVLGQIADYNEYDCISTLALRDWLLGRALEHGISPGSAVREAPTRDIPDPDPVYLELAGIVEGFPLAGRT
ncbi:MAG: hypothetical protein QOI70_250 [Microbacteriaceae bacterium]|jgi:uncharacterized protein|nr:hypothetical protein [Microbacteriaceae bacterium]